MATVSQQHYSLNITSIYFQFIHKESAQELPHLNMNEIYAMFEPILPVALFQASLHNTNITFYQNLNLCLCL